MLNFLSGENFICGNPVMSYEEIENVRSYVESDFDFGEFEVGYAYFAGALIIRYYSDEAGYHFEAPIPISSSSDFELAYLEITEYCKLQRIPEVIIGVPVEPKELVLRGALNYSISEDEDGTLVVEIYTECMIAEELPEYLSGDVYLGEFAASYADEYEKLVKNVNLNRYFGYNITDDLPNGNGEDFINLIRDDFDRSESITLAATVMSETGENVFVGEGTLYAFDGRGGASLSFRVLPEYHGRGFGKKIFAALFRIAQQIGVHTLFAEVMRENAPSLHILESYSAPVELDGEKYKFIFDVKIFVK